MASKQVIVGMLAMGRRERPIARQRDESTSISVTVLAQLETILHLTGC